MNLALLAYLLLLMDEEDSDEEESQEEESEEEESEDEEEPPLKKQCSMMKCAMVPASSCTKNHEVFSELKKNSIEKGQTPEDEAKHAWKRDYCNNLYAEMRKLSDSDAKKIKQIIDSAIKDLMRKD